MPTKSELKAVVRALVSVLEKRIVWNLPLKNWVEEVEWRSDLEWDEGVQRASIALIHISKHNGNGATKNLNISQVKVAEVLEQRATNIAEEVAVKLKKPNAESMVEIADYISDLQTKSTHKWIMVLNKFEFSK